MPSQSRGRVSKACKATGSRTVRQNHSSSVPEAISKAGISTSTEPQFRLRNYVSNHIRQKHQKSVRDDYDEVLKAIGRHRDAHPGHAGDMERVSFEHKAGLMLGAGLEAVEPAIAIESVSHAGVLNSEYQPYVERVTKSYEKKKLEEERIAATLKRDKHKEGKIMDALRSFQSETHGKLDDLDPANTQEAEGEHSKDSESTAKADTPAEEQFNADSNEEQIDLDEEDSEDGPASVYSPEDDETSGSEA